MTDSISLNLKDKIIGYCRTLELDTIGFTECRVFEESRNFFEERSSQHIRNEFEEENVDRRINPFMLHSRGKTIISIAFPYLFDKENNKGAYFSLYTRGRDYHNIVSEYLRKICSFIESLGGSSEYFVDSNALPERYIAFLSGIGFIGKNNMLITKKYGSYVFLGEIITDLEIESDRPIENGCGGCSLCTKACPAAVLGGSGDYSSCLSYITQKKHISDEEMLKFKGRLFGCDTCQNVCPYNSQAGTSKLLDFTPFDFMKSANLEEISEINSSIFREKYALSSCGWRGKNVLQRNALINMAQIYEPKKLKDINEKNISSPYVKDYYHRLLKLYQL